MKNKLIFWSILLIIVLRITVFLYINQSYFTRGFNSKYFSDLYSQSQYVIGNKSVGGIGDDGLYAFAGWYYFFQGGDVSAVNFEHPPLGKYLIGLSIFLFGNENVISLIYLALLFFVVYKIGLKILTSINLALLSILILSFDNLLLDNLIRSLIDLPFTLFFICAVYFFILGLEKKEYYIFSNIFWGLAFSTRFFPSLVLIQIFLMGFLFIIKRRDLKQFIITTLVIPIIYLITHISYFIYHPSFVEFLRHKKWMLAWFSGTPIKPGNIWLNILSGKYLDSTDKLVSNEHWNVLIPLVTVLGIFSFRLKYIKSKAFVFIAVYGVTVVFILYLTFMTGGAQKFLLPIYPLLVILAISNLASFYSIIKKCKMATSVRLRVK